MRFQRASTIYSGPSQSESVHGGGIFRFFSTIFKKLLPLAKSALGLGVKAVKSQAGQNLINAASEVAADAGKKVAKDILEGKNVKKASGEGLKSAGKKVAKAAKRTAVQAGLDIIDDTLQGQNLKASAKKRLTAASKQLLTEVAAKGNTTMKKSRGKKGPGRGKKKSGGGGARRGAGKKRTSGGSCSGRGKSRGAGKKKVLKIKKNNIQHLGKQLVRQWL